MYEIMFNGMVNNKVQKLTGWIRKDDLVNPILRKMFKISRTTGIKPQAIIGKRYNAGIDEIEYLVRLKNTKSKPIWYPEWKMMAFYHQVVEPYNKKQKSDSEEEKEYEVEKVLDKKLDSFNNIHYFVKWLGYGESENSWEPVENLQTSVQLIEEFENSLNSSTQNIVSNDDTIYISDSDDCIIVQTDEVNTSSQLKTTNKRVKNQGKNKAVVSLTPNKKLKLDKNESKNKTPSLKAYDNESSMMLDSNCSKITEKNIFTLMEDENYATSKNKESGNFCDKNFSINLTKKLNTSKIQDQNKNINDLQQMQIVKPEYDKAIFRGGFTDGISKVLLIENPETGKLFQMSYTEAQLLYSTDFNKFFMSRKMLPF